jgi:hypothetical protein
MSRGVLWAAVLVVVTPASVLAQQPIDVACSPSTPVVSASETIRVRAWATSAGESLSFRWATTTGLIGASGVNVEWTPEASEARPYRATVRVDGAGGAWGTCTVEVWPAVGGRGPGDREAGRALLVPGAQAPGGYGLYSYILFGAAPLETKRERYLKSLEAWRTLVPALAELERYLKPDQLNVVLVPVQKAADGRVSAEWLLENYDYARARVLLRAVGRSGRDGPYIVSTLQPLGEGAPLTGEHLFQDMSSVPPALVAAWTSEFLTQSAQQRFSEARTGPQLALRMRTTLRILGMGLGDVQNSLGQWISWGAKLATEPGK